MDEQWTEILLKVEINSLETAEAIAAEISTGGIFVEDYSDMEETLPLIGGVDYIDDSLMKQDKTHGIVHIYAQKEEKDQMLESLKLALEKENVKYTIESEDIETRDWANEWKEFFKVEKLGERLVLRPSWEEYEAKDGEKVLTIDPGESFGSGKSETTSMCLEFIDKTVKGGEKVLDMGCGSGILAIGALLLGAKSAIGADVEKNAVKESRENAEINGVGGRFDVRMGNALSDAEFEKALGGDFDLILANITADVHLAMAGLYLKKLKKGGDLIVSGIISERENEVKEALCALGFEVVESKIKGEWSAIHFRISR